MAFQAPLDNRGTLTLEQHGEQTLISVQRPGQAQASSVQTGLWSVPPRLHKLENRFMVEFQTNPPVYYMVHGDQARLLDEVPELTGSELVELEEVPDGQGLRPMKPMVPMKPMKPM